MASSRTILMTRVRLCGVCPRGSRWQRTRRRCAAPPSTCASSCASSASTSWTTATIASCTWSRWARACADDCGWGSSPYANDVVIACLPWLMPSFSSHDFVVLFPFPIITAQWHYTSKRFLACYIKGFFFFYYTFSKSRSASANSLRPTPLCVITLYFCWAPLLLLPWWVLSPVVLSCFSFHSSNHCSFPLFSSGESSAGAGPAAWWDLLPLGPQLLHGLQPLKWLPARPGLRDPFYSRLPFHWEEHHQLLWDDAHRPQRSHLLVTQVRNQGLKDLILAV